MSEQITDFDWSPLGEKWWRENGAVVKASEAQKRFACLKHRGLAQGKAISNTAAARQAGYSDNAGDPGSIRQIAYRTARTNAVQHLIAMATAEMRGEVRGPVDAAAMRRELEKMVTGPDPQGKLRAIELLMKMDDRRSTLGQAPDNDGFFEWRFVREFLRQANGAAALVLLWTGLGNSIVSLPLLHDVAHAAQQQAPEVWDREVAALSPQSRGELVALLNNENWQLQARRTLWFEIGVALVGSAPVDVSNIREFYVANAAASPDGSGDGEHAAVVGNGRSLNGSAQGPYAQE